MFGPSLLSDEWALKQGEVGLWVRVAGSKVLTLLAFHRGCLILSCFQPQPFSFGFALHIFQSILIFRSCALQLKADPCLSGTLGNLHLLASPSRVMPKESHPLWCLHGQKRFQGSGEFSLLSETWEMPPLVCSLIFYRSLPCSIHVEKGLVLLLSFFFFFFTSPLKSQH